MIVKAANEGRTLVELAPRDAITQDFEILADRLLGLDAPQPAKAGFKLFGRTMAARA